MVLAFGAGKDTTFTHDGTTGLDIAVTDNDGGALTIKEAGNSYLTVDTTDGVEKLLVGQDLQRAAGARDLSHHLAWSAMDDMYGKADTEVDHAWILNKGSDGSAADPAIDTAQAGGVWKLVTGAGDGSTAQDGSQLVWADMPIQLDSNTGPYVIEARVRIKTAVTNVAVFFGLTDATGLEEPFTNSADTITSTATDGAGFLFDTDATTDEWWGVAVDTDTDDTGNATTGVVPVADTWQILRMEVDATGATINFFIDNAAAADLALSAAAGCGPDAVLYPTLIACGDGTASKTVDVDWIRVEGVR